MNFISFSDIAVKDSTGTDANWQEMTGEE